VGFKTVCDLKFKARKPMVAEGHPVKIELTLRDARKRWLIWAEKAHHLLTMLATPYTS
jgi:hypothetical protein